MRTIAVAATTAALVLLGASSGQAQTYPFCASYNDETGATNCGFSTMEQCRAAISGAGGFCGINPVYHAKRNSTPRRAPRGR